MNISLRNLLDLEELDVEDQGAVGGDAGKGAAAVGVVGRDGEATLATDSHAGNTDVPALDDLTLAELEGERGTLLVSCIKTLVSGQNCESEEAESETYNRRPCRSGAFRCSACRHGRRSWQYGRYQPSCRRW